MPDSVAIALSNITKIYKLYDNIVEQALDVFGIAKLRFWKKPVYSQFPALNDLNLSINLGERIGIVGRNGAGKTTLLKLITGNFSPTSGNVAVNGSIQALMNVGLGFHPEFTGLENIKAALVYNGLNKTELEEALNDIVDFVELGEYLKQPLKSYSAGMEARLMFAVATAVRPDILIVDEILGAGDAYFTAKSASRMEKLASSGCTLLLVSHSMQQLIQFCEKAIWIEKGKIVMQGDVLDVVKAYEEFTQRLQIEMGQITSTDRKKNIVDQSWFRDQVVENVLNGQISTEKRPTSIVSRWPSEEGLKIKGVRVLNASGEQIHLTKTSEELSIEITITAETDGDFKYTCVVLLFSEDGRPLSRHISQRHEFLASSGDQVSKELNFPQLLLGNGEYIISVALFEDFDPEFPSSSKRFDLLSRSFSFEVVDKYRQDPSVFHHPANWR